jgi:tetratricopeptide (TPR) repeat protein
MFDTSWLFANQAYMEAVAIHYIKGLGDACLRKGLLAQWHHWDIREMAKYFSEAIYWYEKISDDDGLGNAFYGMGRAARGLGTVTTNLASAANDELKAFSQSAFHFRRAGNNIMLAELIDQFGLVYNDKGDFEKYFESIKHGFKEKQRINDNRGIIWSYYRLAYVYMTIGDYETALDYLRKSYSQDRSQSVPWKIGRTMGDVFISLKNYDSALYYYNDIFKHLPGDGSTLVSIGKLYIAEKKYDSALYYLQKSIPVLKKTNNDGRLMMALIEIGRSYLGRKEFSNALQQSKEGLKIAQWWNAKDIIQQAYEINWKAFDAIKKTDSAYYYLQKFVPLKDSLENARFKLQNVQKLTFYKAEAKEEEQQARINLLNKDNQLKQQQLKKEALIKQILGACLIVLMVLTVIVFRNIILKRRNEKLRLENELKEQQLASERKQAELQKQTSELEMQALRSQMNPHFIFNCLNSINRFILKNETESASDYLTKFSKLIRLVLNNSKHKYITLNEEMDCLELYIQMEQLRSKNSFRYKIKCAATIDAEEMLIPPLLLQPFVENAIWHGLMNREDGAGDLNILLQQKNELLECTIADNGVGRKAALELSSKSAKHKSMALQITKERIALLHVEQKEDSIEIEDLYDDNGNATGTKVMLRIKYKIAAEKVFL